MGDAASEGKAGVGTQTWGGTREGKQSGSMRNIEWNLYALFQLQITTDLAKEMELQ